MRSHTDTLTDGTGQGAVQDTVRGTADGTVHGVAEPEADDLVVAGIPITSRLIMGTGGAANLEILERALRAHPAASRRARRPSAKAAGA